MKLNQESGLWIIDMIFYIKFYFKLFYIRIDIVTMKWQSDYPQTQFHMYAKLFEMRGWNKDEWLNKFIRRLWAGKYDQGDPKQRPGQIHPPFNERVWKSLDAYWWSLDACQDYNRWSADASEYLNGEVDTYIMCKTWILSTILPMEF